MAWNQIHAGKSAINGNPLWHSDNGGKYWSGNWGDRTAEELLEECQSIIDDLLKNHPEITLRKKLEQLIESPLSSDQLKRMIEIAEEEKDPFSDD